MWHVSSRSSVAILRTAIHLLLSSYNASPDLVIEWTAFNNITKIMFTKRGFFSGTKYFKIVFVFGPDFTRNPTGEGKTLPKIY